MTYVPKDTYVLVYAQNFFPGLLAFTYIINHCHLWRMELFMISPSTAWMDESSSYATHQQLVGDLKVNDSIQLFVIFGKHFIQLKKASLVIGYK